MGNEIDPKTGQPIQRDPNQEFRIPDTVPGLAEIEISDDDYRQAMDSKEGFLGAMKKMVGVGEQRAIQRVIPSVNVMIRNQIALWSIVNDFYTDNPDLRQYKPFVSFIYQDLQGKNPNWDVTKVLTEAEKIVRDKMNLPRDKKKDEIVVTTTNGKGKKPKFAKNKGKQGRRFEDDNRSDKQKQIDAMLESAKSQ